jgi:DNA-binding response OmpR family regulator
VDLTRRELRADGKVTPVGGRAFELPEILVRASGEVVSKSELLDRVWPSAIVSENALEVHVLALRRVLGADRAMLKTVSDRVLREGTGRSDDRDGLGERLQPAGHRISSSAEGRTF